MEKESVHLPIADVCYREEEGVSDIWILIVDDSPTMRALISKVLKTEGYTSKQVANGQEALDILSKESPDLVLLDIDMPVMDGLTTLTEIRKRKEYDQIPIIMVTSVQDRDIIKTVLSKGANDYVSKPFDNVELLARAGSHIRVKRLNDERERLYRQAEIYYQSFKNAHDGVIITDLKGTAVDINEAFTALYGYPREEMMGQNMSIIHSPNTPQGQLGQIWEDIRNPEKGEWFGEIINLHKDGREIPVILSMTTIKINGSPIGYMGLSVDITDRKRLEESLRNYNQDLEEKVRERTLEIEDTQDATIIGLAKIAEYRDPETGEHLDRIRNYTQILAAEIGKLDKYEDFVTERFVDLIYKSSPLHDIGKVGIPDSILLKPGKLTKEEFEIMKRHAVVGGDTIAATEKRLKDPKNSFLSMGKEIAYYHHERWDGSGYPFGLKGEKIPLSARIMSLTDVYDALTSKRVYKEAFPHEKARNLILDERGRHFDPEIVDAFLKVENVFIEVKNRFSEVQQEPPREPVGPS